MPVTVFLQMSPYKNAAKKKSSKCQHTSLDAFRGDDVDMAYNDYYKRVSIILERTVELRVPRTHFHP